MVCLVINFSSLLTLLNITNPLIQNVGFPLDDIDDAVTNGKIVKDFLPPPELLVAKEETKKITISLSKRSIEFF